MNITTVDAVEAREALKMSRSYSKYSPVYEAMDDMSHKNGLKIEHDTTSDAQRTACAIRQYVWRARVQGKFKISQQNNILWITRKDVDND